MALVEDIEATVGKGDAFAQEAPALQLMLEGWPIKYLLRYDLRDFHARVFDMVVFY